MLGRIRTSPEWTMRAAVAVLVLGLVAALTGIGVVKSDAVLDVVPFAGGSAEPLSPTTLPASTTTALPSVFGALAAGAPRAVVTPTGVVGPLVEASAAGFVIVTPCGSQAAVTGSVLTGAHVVLDPGHGGVEPGAVGPTGLTEKEVNLDVALRAARILEAAGASVVLTRSTDIRMTLATRADIVTALQPTALVSIHHNAAPVSSQPSPAPEMYAQVARADSARLAGLLHEEMVQAFTPFPIQWSIGRRPGVNARVSSNGGDYYGILRRSAAVPAVLSEPAYISAPAEEALLRTPEFREAEASAIAAAVTRYVTTPDDPALPVDTFSLAVPAGGGGGSRGCVDPPLA